MGLNMLFSYNLFFFGGIINHVRLESGLKKKI